MNDICFLDQYSIRPWQASDACLLAKYANNRKIWLNLRDGFPHPYSENDANTFITENLENPACTNFAIADNTGPIGGIGLTIGTDIHRYSAELGYWLGEPFWRKGITTAAIQKFCEYAFNTYELNRIYALPFANNQASIKALINCGFIKEGVLIASAYKNDSYIDQCIYAKFWFK